MASTESARLLRSRGGTPPEDALPVEQLFEVNPVAVEHVPDETDVN
jgi:hypothetical protein